MIQRKLVSDFANRLAVSRPRGPLFTVLFLTLFLLGCQKDEIRSYRVPKEDTDSEADVKEAVPTRLLGVIVPHGNRTWFFKLSGPAAPVDVQKETFDRFMASVRFRDQGDKPVAWSLPEGWKEEAGGSALRYATLRFQSQDVPLELSVTFFQGEGGSLLDNFNRWRSQIGLSPVSEGKLGEVTKAIEVDGVKATYVYMLGIAGPGGAGMKPPFAKRQPRGDADGAKPITFTAPPGWQEIPDSTGLRRTIFRITEGDKTAEASITPLGGPAGGLLANVNRWRDQVHLDRITEEQLQKDAGTLEIGGKKASYVDLIGPEGPNRQRIVAASIVGPDRSWFFTLKGPSDFVGKQKPAFVAFLKTVQFTGGGE